MHDSLRSHFPPASNPAEVCDPLPITDTCLRQITATLGARPPECGLVLGGDRADGIVRHVYFDHTASCTGVTYAPDTTAINALLAASWNPAGISLLGLVHSHPGSDATLSPGDLTYAGAILSANPGLPKLWLPLVTLEGGFRLHPFVVVRSERGVEAYRTSFQILREELKSDYVGAVASTTTHALRAVVARLRTLARHPRRPWCEGGSFARVQSAYDLPHLARSRVLVVGLGGSMLWNEELARCGVGEFVGIDPDNVTLPNIGTQQFYRDEVGKPKVEVFADRIWRINPEAKIWIRRVPLDALSDGDLANLAGLRETPPPAVTLLAAMTDSFPAQARMNRLALHLGLPLIAGQVYAEGRGVEVAWSFPGVSKTCMRCALRPRYRAYLTDGFVNTVGSAGAPICATSRLTALKDFVALALLHHGSSHPRWGPMLARIGQRTLIQARLHPDLELPVFAEAFGNDPRVFCDETVWLPQTPSISSPCPDCDGRGADPWLIGRDGDTRLIRGEQRS